MRMKQYTQPSPRLTERDASLVKGMLLRGDKQSDIAAYFSVNLGRVAEIATGQKFPDVSAASRAQLPIPGPYVHGEVLALVTRAVQVVGLRTVCVALLGLIEAAIEDSASEVQEPIRRAA